MIWLVAALVIALVFFADYFRSKAVYFENEMNYWRNESMKQHAKLGHRVPDQEQSPRWNYN